MTTPTNPELAEFIAELLKWEKDEEGHYKAPYWIRPCAGRDRRPDYIDTPPDFGCIHWEKKDE